MIEKITNLLKKQELLIPSMLFFNYKDLNISDSELILLIYLINQPMETFNPKAISNDLKLTLAESMNIINSLCDKRIISLETVKKNHIHNEVISLNSLYEKLAFIIINDKKQDNSNNLFSLFEKEFGRTLSPMEFEIINAWKDGGFTEELIILALKEATYNGVSNLRYIDKILHEWKKKGIKNEKDIESERKSFQEKKIVPKKLVDYDWLNENE